MLKPFYKNLQIMSIVFLNFNYKFIAVLLVYFFICYSITDLTHISYSMGNCLNSNSTLCEDHISCLEPRHFLTLQGVQAENQALNNIIQDLRRQLIDLSAQITDGIQHNEQQTKMIQQLLAEQEQMKELLIQLEIKLSCYEIQKHFLEEHINRCMR